MIRMNDFVAESDALKEEEKEAMCRVLESGLYVLGREVKAFENAWSGICGSAHAVGVGNGMDAIEIGLRLLDVGPGDEIITTSMTAFATVLAIIRTALMDPTSAERCIGSKTKALVLVHLYGQVRNMERWLELCSHYHISMLEDCAQSHLATWNGRVAGTFGEVGAHSFYPTKNLGAMGDGGAILVGTKEMMDRAEALRNYGESGRYNHVEYGLNSRLDEMQAAILCARLPWLRNYTDRRREIAATYNREIINSSISLMDAPLQPLSHVYHLFVIQSERRDQLSDYLENRGVVTGVHYPIPIHCQRPTSNIRRDKVGLRSAERHSRRCLSIPCHPQMSDRDVDRVVDVINSFR